MNCVIDPSVPNHSSLPTFSEKRSHREYADIFKQPLIPVATSSTTISIIATRSVVSSCCSWEEKKQCCLEPLYQQ